jgi:hypothetical protein
MNKKIKELLASGESETVELKTAFGKDVILACEISSCTTFIF